MSGMYYRNVVSNEYHVGFSGFTIYKKKGSNVIFFMGPQEVLEDMLGNHTVHNHLRAIVGSMNFPNIDYKINPEIYCDFDQFIGPESGEDAYAMSEERATDPPDGIPLFAITIFPKYTFRSEYDTFLSIKVEQGSIWKAMGSSLVRYRFYKAAYLEGNENSTLVPYYPMKSEEYTVYIRHEIRKLHNYHFGNGLFNRTFKMEIQRVVFTDPNYFDVEIDYRSSDCLHFACEQEYPIFEASMFFPLSVMGITGFHSTQSHSIRWLMEMIGKQERIEHDPLAQCQGSGSLPGSLPGPLPGSLPTLATAPVTVFTGSSPSLLITPLMAVVPDLDPVSTPAPAPASSDMDMNMTSDANEESFSGKRKLDQYKEEHKNDPKDPNDPAWRR